MSRKVAENMGHNKRAIVVSSFGTSNEKALKSTIEKIEQLIKQAYKEYEVRIAFTSDLVTETLKQKHGIHVDTLKQVLEKLKLERYESIIIQPLHIIPGEEYQHMVDVVDELKRQKSFNTIVLGKPLLYLEGKVNENINDYAKLVEALKDQMPELLNESQGIVLMGHGTKAMQANANGAKEAYEMLQHAFSLMNLKNIFIGVMEGSPSLSTVIESLKKKHVEEVILMPLLLTPGHHAINHMAGEDDCSWKSILEKEGFKVNIYLSGIGENSKVRDIYLEHLKDAIASMAIDSN